MNAKNAVSASHEMPMLFKVCEKNVNFFQKIYGMFLCVYPWLGNFSFSQILLFFHSEECLKKLWFYAECPDWNAFIFFVESGLLNVLSHIGCQGMFLSMQDKH